MNTLTLFDLSECDKLKTPLQAEFETNNMDLLCAFPAIVLKSVERLNKEVFSTIEPHSRDNKLAATAMSGFMRGHLKAMFPDLCGSATKTRFCMKMKDATKVYIKKLDDNFRPMGIATKNTAKIIYQRTDSQDETIGNVILGYTSSYDNTSIIGVYAVCIDGEKRLWLSDLSALAKNNNKTIDKTITSTQETALKPGTVKIKEAGNG